MGIEFFFPLLLWCALVPFLVFSFLFLATAGRVRVVCARWMDLGVLFLMATTLPFRL